jgi:hypothetical protein
MPIILDTNIIQTDFLMKSVRFDILIDYSKKTRNKIVIPEIVLDELRENYKRELLSKIHQYSRAKGSLEKILTNISVPNISIDIDKEVKAYIEHVLSRLYVQKEDIFRYKDEYLRGVIKRAVQRKRPCSGSGEEIRDAILWHSIVDIAKDAPDNSVIFISNNTNQFADKDQKLHPDLLIECKENEISVAYHITLEEFAKQHAEPIEFITAEWITKQVDIKDILKKIENEVESQASNDLISYLGDYQSPTGYFNLVQWFEEITSFYVYKMSDGSIRIEVEYSGEAEVECEVEAISRKEFYDQNYEVMISSSTSSGEEYIIRNMSEVVTSFEYLYPQLYLTLDLVVENDKVVNWKVVEFQLE